MIEAASPNFNVGRTPGRALVIDLCVVALREPSALRMVLLASHVARLCPLIGCERRLRDATWGYLRRKHLTDFVKEMIFEDEPFSGYRIGPPPATIAVQQITLDNAGRLAHQVMALR